jgi:NAD(P)-dependent dehydrogenase (short-subunit alcohol dehydrogenase family)
VVVTGASTGIGRATALHLDNSGFHVFAGVRRASDAEALGRVGSGRLVPLRIDVTDVDSIQAAAETVFAQVSGDGLRGLVNNAGIGVAGALEFLPLAELRRQFEVNVVGPVGVSQAFLPQIRKARGRIINVGSIGGRLPMPLLGAYCASKAALKALTDSMRLELRPWRVWVSLVEPGIIATPMFERARDQADLMLRDVPNDMRRLYQPCIDAVRRAVLEQVNAASAPEVVARVVGQALTARRPRTSYVVGRHGRLEALIAALLPDRMRDAVIARALRLPTSR